MEITIRDAVGAGVWGDTLVPFGKFDCRRSADHAVHGNALLEWPRTSNIHGGMQRLDRRGRDSAVKPQNDRGNRAKSTAAKSTTRHAEKLRYTS